MQRLKPDLPGGGQTRGMLVCQGDAHRHAGPELGEGCLHSSSGSASSLGEKLKLGFPRWKGGKNRTYLKLTCNLKC